MVREKKKGKDGTRGGGEKANDGSPEEIVGDSRFSKIHSDPRFQRLPRHKTKVPIDSRFAHMFHDKAFAEKKIDKRGGATKTNKQDDFLRRYYKYDEEEGEEEEDDEDSGHDSDSDEQVGSILRIGKQKGKKGKELKKSRKKKLEESESGSEGGVEEESAEEVKDRHSKSKAKIGAVANGVEEDEVESDVDSEEEENDSELDEDGDREEEESSSSSSSSESESEDDEVPKEEEKVPTTDHETNRLALMNMDWDHIRAVDLLVVLRSFQPKGGTVESVTIYPSEFGIEQMAKDASQGPQEIFRHDDDGSEDEADPEKLREYEKAKLRYYYAVAVCDSVATAACIYTSCDGLEYEKTSNTLDLRFIPDDIKFTREPKDSANDIPNDYKPVEFETKALQHSNVKLTWDDDEPLRARALRRKFNADQLNEQDYRDYIASSSSESGSESEAEGEESGDEEKATDEEKQKLREKYLSLLSDSGEKEGNVVGKKVEKGNIEIKFNTGLDELSEKLTEKLKKTKTDETVWEAYLRKKKEKKKARKNKANADDDSDFSDEDGGTASDGGPHGKDDPFFTHDEDPFDDPFFQDDSSQPAKGKNKGKKSKELEGSTTIGSKFASSAEERKKKKEEAALEKKEEERRKAELELLLMDDDVVQNGGAPIKTQKDSQKKESKGNKKKKKGKEKAEVVQEKLAASANYEDPRFSGLFTSHHYALDPTDPQFKKSAAQLSTIAEKQRQRLESGGVKKKDEEDLGNGNVKKRKAELSSLVRSLKSKVQARK